MTGMIKRLEELARDEVEAILASLPAPLAGPARQVPVIYEARPDPDDGQEEDLLGLFTGPELACEGDEPLPPQIILFLENIWDEAGEKESAFRDEVRITYLHELGHYLGLDEKISRSEDWIKRLDITRNFSSSQGVIRKFMLERHLTDYQQPRFLKIGKAGFLFLAFG